MWSSERHPVCDSVGVEFERCDNFLQALRRQKESDDIIGRMNNAACDLRCISKKDGGDGGRILLKADC